MADTEWRLSGGIGSTPPLADNQSQNMLQGIGFPLRPVDGVPPQDTGDQFNTESAAQGIFMQFMPQGYEEGKYYARGATINNGLWSMVANKLTLEYPFPVAQGDNNFGLTSYTPTAPSDNATVFSGHDYTFNEPCWVKALRVWVTEITPDISYRIVTVHTDPQGDISTTVIENPSLVVGAWSIVQLGDKLVRNGSSYRVYIDALNSGATNEVSGGWGFTGKDNVAAPPTSSWNHDNANEVVRIDKTDLDLTDRTSELLGISVNSTLQFVNTDNTSQANTYRVIGDPTDSGTYVGYPVTLQSQTGGGLPNGTTTLTATVPVPQPTQYAEQAATLPTFTQNVVAAGFLQFDGVDQGGIANAYGIDIEVESTTVPLDWDVLSFSTP